MTVALALVVLGCLGVYAYTSRHVLAGTPLVVAEHRGSQILFYLVAPTDAILLALDTPSPFGPEFSIWTADQATPTVLEMPSPLREGLVHGPGFVPDGALWIDNRRVQVPACLGPGPELPGFDSLARRRPTAESCWAWFVFDLSADKPTVTALPEPVVGTSAAVLSKEEPWGGSAQAARMDEARLRFTGGGWHISLLDEARGRTLTTHWVPLISSLRPYDVTLSPSATQVAYALGGMRGFAWSEAFVVRRVDGNRWRLVIPGGGTAARLQWHPTKPRLLYGTDSSSVYVWRIPDLPASDPQ